MPDQITLRANADERLRDAQALFQQARYDGAAYICGYAIEFALKARICEHLSTGTYPDKLASFKTHDLETLLFLSGLEKLILENAIHSATWSLATAKWQPEMRYKAKSITQNEARSLLDATAILLPLL